MVCVKEEYVWVLNVNITILKSHFVSSKRKIVNVADLQVTDCQRCRFAIDRFQRDRFQCFSCQWQLVCVSSKWQIFKWQIFQETDSKETDFRGTVLKVSVVKLRVLQVTVSKVSIGIFADVKIISNLKRSNKF